VLSNTIEPTTAPLVDNVLAVATIGNLNPLLSLLEVPLDIPTPSALFIIYAIQVILFISIY
jgi:hypothetical protein